MIRRLLATFLVFASVTALAQQKTAAPNAQAKKPVAKSPTKAASDSGPAEVADIRKLLELTGSRNMVNQMKGELMAQFRQASPTLPTEMFDEMLAEMKPEDLEEAIIPIYVKHFTESDIKQLIAFYESPFGRKVMSKLPEIMQESNQVGAEWGQNIVTRVAGKWRDEGKITQHEYEQLVGPQEP